MCEARREPHGTGAVGPRTGPGQPGITADRLAHKLGVSERAARRYVGILREAGIPIESVRGP
jgi:DNA-binding IscR family transcriptional regulator